MAIRGDCHHPLTGECHHPLTKKQKSAKEHAWSMVTLILKLNDPKHPDRKKFENVKTNLYRTKNS